MMYVLEYLIYHLKPYGFNTVVKAECPIDHTNEANSTALKQIKEAIQGANSNVSTGQGANSNGPSVSEGGSVIGKEAGVVSQGGSVIGKEAGVVSQGGSVIGKEAGAVSQGGSVNGKEAGVVSQGGSVNGKEAGVVSQGGSVNGKEAGVQAGEVGEGMDKNEQEDFVESPETIDVNIKENYNDNDLARNMNKRNLNIINDGSVEKNSNFRAKPDMSKIIPVNKNSDIANKNSIMLKALRSKK